MKLSDISLEAIGASGETLFVMSCARIVEGSEGQIGVAAEGFSVPGEPFQPGFVVHKIKLVGPNWVSREANLGRPSRLLGADIFNVTFWLDRSTFLNVIGDDFHFSSMQSRPPEDNSGERDQNDLMELRRATKKAISGRM